MRVENVDEEVKLVNYYTPGEFGSVEGVFLNRAAVAMNHLAVRPFVTGSF